MTYWPTLTDKDIQRVIAEVWLSLYLGGGE